MKLACPQTDFPPPKNAQIPNFMKIRSVGAAIHAERLTDGTDRHDEGNSRFSQFYDSV
jgi:hypothetical protein